MLAAFTPAMWGMGGAFVYAGPRWLKTALVGSPETRAHPLLATVDLLICLLIGAIGAAAFGSLATDLALTVLHVRDHNAACAAIGLFMNPLAPSIVQKGAGALDGGATVFLRVLQAIRGTEK